MGWIGSSLELAARGDQGVGLDADGLRARLGEPALLAAVLDFLAAHEPDLVDVAAEIDETPDALVAARQALAA